MRQIMMVCVASRIEGGRHVNTFRPLPLAGGWLPVEAVMDCAAVPGMPYELRIVGVFPGFVEGRECSSDMLEFSSPGRLHSVDATEKWEMLDPQTGKLKCLGELPG